MKVLYLAMMFTLPLLDAFDRWWKRTAIHFDSAGVVSYDMSRSLVWGDWPKGWFVVWRLPFLRTWGTRFYDFRIEQGWRSHTLQYDSVTGWKFFPPLNGE